ncbi:autoimmune regulator-like isoform X2 [Passer montanus]|uniref:autoimmune regulator-like isoform X2 n=1 Tax=Passer montanus TaxID=9160 RepID=UPI0019617C05|nr:autoimmune regulator-like isoform X2 [Passer montanus]
MREAGPAESPEILGHAWVTADMREVGVPRQDLTDPLSLVPPGWSPRAGCPSPGHSRPEPGRCLTSSPGLGCGTGPRGRDGLGLRPRTEMSGAAGSWCRGRGLLKGRARAAAGPGSAPAMAGPGSDGDLRRLLKLHRTEIAMAVDDVFPLLHGLADHDVVPDHIFKETLSRAEREGSHRAFHALLTWLLGRDAAAVRDFWAVLFKDYNLERYSRLRPLRGALPREVELGRQRRGRRLSPSPTAPAPHRPQGKRKAPEERDKARAAQPAPRHGASPGMETQSRMEMGRVLSPRYCGVPPDTHPHNAAGPLGKAKTVKKPEGTDTPRTSRASALQAVAASVQRAVAVAGGEVPVSRGAIEGILIKHVLDPNSSKTGSRAGDKPYTPTACEEPEARSRSHSLKPPAQPKACQSNREPQLHPQGQLQAATVYSQDPVPHQENEDECAACGDGGELICCDGCPRAFHLACLVPPLPHVPSGTWRCGSCVENVTEPGQLLEADLPVERPPEMLGEAARDTQPGGAEGSVCSRCCTRIPTPHHCPAPTGDPRGLLLCMSCTGTLDTGGLGTTAAAGEQLLPAAKAEDGALGGDPVLSREELDALLGESTWDGILHWAFQTMARPLAETQEHLA